MSRTSKVDALGKKVDFILASLGLDYSMAERLDRMLAVQASASESLLSGALQVSSLIAENQRMRDAMDRLPEGWSVTKISETKVRIDAMTTDGVMCHWILDALEEMPC